MSQALCFNDVTLTPVSHQNSIWIKASELARALGYKREDQVAKIYRTNADEFTPDMTQVVEIVDNADLAFPVKTRIFSLRGCHLLSMFARTPIAKAFRKWVLDVLDKMTAESTAKPAIPATITPSTPADRKPLDKLVKVWAQQAGLIHATAWTQVNAHFNLDSVAQLPVEWIPDAIAFVEGKISALAAIEARALPTEPAALPPPDTLAPAALKPAQMRRLAEKLAALEDLDNRFSQFRANTHENMYLMAREYIQLSEGVFYQLLGFNNSNTLSETQYLANPLIGQSYDAQTWVDSGMQRMSAAIRAARSATRVMMGA